MNCKKCGAILTENDQFCKSCGAAVGTPNKMTGQSSVVSPVSNVQTQQPMQNQPTLVNGYNSNSNFQTFKKNSGFGKYILIGLCIIVAIIAVVYVIGSIDNNSNSGSSSEIIKVSNSTYSVNFEGFTFEISTDLIYKIDEDALYIGDEDGTWQALIDVASGSFSKLQSNKGQLISVYQEAGYSAANISQKTYSGLDFITIELSKNGQNVIFGFTKANSMYVFGVTVFNLDNDFDYDLLTNIAEILSTAKYSDEKNNIFEFNKVDMSLVDELVK